VEITELRIHPGFLAGQFSSEFQIEAMRPAFPFQAEFIQSLALLWKRFKGQRLKGKGIEGKLKPKVKVLII